MNTLAGFVGPISLDTFLAIYVAWVVVFIGLVLWAIVEVNDFYKKRKAKLKAEAAREAESLIGADATPSLMYQRCDGNDTGSIAGMFLVVCANRDMVPVVEDVFHDLECEHPCADRHLCALAG